MGSYKPEKDIKRLREDFVPIIASSLLGAVAGVYFATGTLEVPGVRLFTTAIILIIFYLALLFGMELSAKLLRPFPLSVYLPIGIIGVLLLIVYMLTYDAVFLWGTVLAGLILFVAGLKIAYFTWRKK